MLDIDPSRFPTDSTFISLEELAALFCVKPRVIRNLALRHPTFPRPVQTSPGKSAFWVPDVRAWFAATVEEIRTAPRVPVYSARAIAKVRDATDASQRTLATTIDAAIDAHNAAVDAIADAIAADLKRKFRYV